MLRLAVTGAAGGSAHADGAGTDSVGAECTGTPTAAAPLTRGHVDVGSMRHRPGAGLSVVYREQYELGATRVHEHLVASAVDLPEPPGVAVLRRGSHAVRVWRRADDPF